jgi:hypothetical protein
MQPQQGAFGQTLLAQQFEQARVAQRISGGARHPRVRDANRLNQSAVEHRPIPSSGHKRPSQGYSYPVNQA